MKITTEQVNTVIRFFLITGLIGQSSEKGEERGPNTSLAFEELALIIDDDV